MDPVESPAVVLLPLNDPTCVVVSLGNANRVNSMLSRGASATSASHYLSVDVCVGDLSLTIAAGVSPTPTTHQILFFAMLGSSAVMEINGNKITQF